MIFFSGHPVSINLLSVRKTGHPVSINLLGVRKNVLISTSIVLDIIPVRHSCADAENERFGSNSCKALLCIVKTRFDISMANVKIRIKMVMTQYRHS